MTHADQPHTIPEDGYGYAVWMCIGFLAALLGIASIWAFA